MLIPFLFIGIILFVMSLLMVSVFICLLDMNIKNKALRILTYYLSTLVVGSGMPIPFLFYIVLNKSYEVTELYKLILFGLGLSTIQILIVKGLHKFNPEFYKDQTDPNRKCMLDYTFTGCVLRGDKEYIRKHYL
jgi:hypothetical protein